ncbi:MAG: tetratricopeptide (TPR) repeat protein, partial [Myxococcota bacterium]
AERYLKLAAPDAEDIAEAKFAAAKIYYDYNHFDKAIPLFQDLYDNHKDFAAMQDAARLMLSVFNVTSDIDNLNKSAEQFSKDPAVAQGDLGVKITEILDQRDFNVCRKMEFEKKYEDAGNCFMKYFQDFPQSKYGDVALNNAAVMYKDAKLIEKALIASEQLYNERSGSPMAPRALYNIGNIYRAIAVYSEAAYYFELYAKNHAKHDPKLLRKALARAATYRVAMGQYDQAVANYATYYKNFSDEKNSEQVFFEIGDVYFEDKNWRAVTKHFKRYLKNYGKKKDANQGNIMAAHSKMGQAFWNSKKKKPALKEFAIALEIFERLRAEAKEAGQDLEIEARAVDAVASAKFYEGEVVLADMKAIKLKLPQKVFTERLGKKINLIAEATKRMQEVAAFGRPQWEIAAFNRIGQAYQNLADAIENAPLPKRMDEEARYMLQEEFQKKANAVRAKAIEAYRICLDRAIKNEWFNEFSENAEKNLAKLDLQYKFTREIRPTPTFYRANATPPSKVEGTAKSANVGAVSAYNSGLAAMTALDPTTALGDFKKAAEADPRFAQAHAMAGLVLEKLGKTAEAEPYLDAALKLEKFNPTAQNVHSVRAQAASDWRKSFAASRQALIGDAENLNAYQNLARTYFLQKQYDMAVLVSRQALEFDKNNAAMWNLLGLTQIKQDQVRAALQSFAKAVEVNPKSVEAQLNLGSAVLNYNDFTRALKHFDAALSVEAGNVTGLTGRAVALRGLSRFDDARSTYAEIIKALPEDPDVRYNQCLLHGEYEEKYEDALAACGEFERLAPPTHRKRKEVEQRVKGLRDTIRFMKEDAAAEPADGAEDGAADGAADNETASDNATSSDNETEPDSD